MDSILQLLLLTAKNHGQSAGNNTAGTRDSPTAMPTTHNKYYRVCPPPGGHINRLQVMKYHPAQD